MKSRVLILCLILLTGTGAFSATFLEIRVNDTDVLAHGISGDGLVVFGAVRGWNPPSGAVPFSWTEAAGISYPSQNDPNYVIVEPSAWAESASYDGDIIVGGSYGNERSRAWRYIRATETYEYLGDLQEYPFITATKISGSGAVIIGTAWPQVGGSVAFRWTQEGGYVLLQQLPGVEQCTPTGITKNGNVIVGYCYDGVAHQSFRWNAIEGTQPYDLPIGYVVTGISADGATLIGSVWVTEGEERAFKYSGSGDPELAPSLATFYMRPTSVSGDGSVVVGATDIGPFIWDSSGIRFLKDFLNTGTWELFDDPALSESGTVITGYGFKTADAEYPSSWVADLNENGGGGGGGSGGGCFISSILP